MNLIKNLKVNSNKNSNDISSILNKNTSSKNLFSNKLHNKLTSAALFILQVKKKLFQTGYFNLNTFFEIISVMFLFCATSFVSLRFFGFICAVLKHDFSLIILYLIEIAFFLSLLFLKHKTYFMKISISFNIIPKILYTSLSLKQTAFYFTFCVLGFIFRNYLIYENLTSFDRIYNVSRSFRFFASLGSGVLLCMFVEIFVNNLKLCSFIDEAKTFLCSIPSLISNTNTKDNTKYNTKHNIKDNIIYMNSKNVFSAKLSEKTYSSLDIISFLVFIIFVNSLSVLFVYNYKTVYIWDTTTYWQLGKELASTHFTLISSKVLKSVMYSDYNYIGSLLLYPFFKIFGTSRLIFILTSVNLTLIPLFITVRKIAKKYSSSENFITLLLVFMFPIAIYIPLVGFIDSFAVFLCLLMLILFIENVGGKSKISMQTSMFFIGFFAVFIMFFRRWYMFYVSSFMFAYLLTQFSKLLSNSLKSNILMLKATFINLVYFSVPLTFISFYLFQTFIVNKLFLFDYFNAYSAYKFNLSTDLMLFFRYYGLIITSIYFLICTYIIIKHNKQKGLFLLFQPILCFFLFTRLQTHGQQHLLLYLPSFIYAYTIFFSIILEKVKNKNLDFRIFNINTNFTLSVNKVCKIVLTLLVAVVFFNTFSIKPQPKSLQEIKNFNLIPAFSFVPTSRNDLTELIAFKTFIKNLSNERHIKVLIVSSSLLFNSDTIINLESSLNLPEIAGDYEILYISQVDKRDGFPYTIFDADYIVVASPVQTHLVPTDQSVITKVADEMLSNSGISNVFSKMNETFQLDNNVTLFTYKKQRDLKPIDAKNLFNYFSTKYEGFDNLFPTFEEYMKKISITN